jgi:pimeloyl-ACP methyl ester carboxylesterase
MLMGDISAFLALHCFPSSSRMFVTLLPLLAGKYRVLAPDYPGFGHSDAPSPEAFAHTFDHLMGCVDRLLEQLGVTGYALYLQDYGGPIGFRLAVAHPERVTALIQAIYWLNSIYLAERFPIEVRAAASAFCYYIGAIFGGVVPPLVTLLAGYHHMALAIAMLAGTVVGAISFCLALMAGPETKGTRFKADLTVA